MNIFFIDVGQTGGGIGSGKSTIAITPQDNESTLAGGYANITLYNASSRGSKRFDFVARVDKVTLELQLFTTRCSHCKI